MATSGSKIFHTVPVMFSALLILLIMTSISHCISVVTKGLKHPLVTLFSSPDIFVGKVLVWFFCSLRNIYVFIYVWETEPSCMLGMFSAITYTQVTFSLKLMDFENSLQILHSHSLSDTICKHLPTLLILNFYSKHLQTRRSQFQWSSIYQVFS